MAGTLTISTLSDGTNSTSATNCIQGSAKAWVNFNGTNGTIYTSYNTSSVTRNSAGNYTMNLTNALTSANYSACGMGGAISGGSGNSTNLFLTTYNLTASAFQFGTLNTSAVNSDQNYVSVALFR